MEEFTPFAAEMARLFGRFGSIDTAVASREELEWMISTAPRFEGFTAVQVAAATVQLERMHREDLAAALRNAGSGPDPNDPPPADPDPANDAGPQPEPDPEPVRPESAEELAVRLLRAKWLRRCELFAAAVQTGTLTPGHIDVLGRVLDHIEPHVVADVLAEEALLVEAARRMSRSAFAKYLHDVIDRVRADGGLTRFQRQLKDSFASFAPDDDTQMYKLFCRIDPIRGAEMHAAVKARVDELYQTKGATDGLDYGQVVLQALHDLICRQPGNDTDSDVGACPEILVICDWQTYLYGQHTATICETAEGIRLPVSFLKDMCAEAMLTVAIAGADGQTLRVGTTQRLATREQRRALQSMYRHCAHHGCTAPFTHCRIHHITRWHDHGPTDLDNLIPLCIKHHHLVHEGHWTLTIDPDRTLRWYRPNGELAVTQPFVPLLTPSQCTTTEARGSPPTAPRAGPAPPCGGTPEDTPSLRLFDPASA